MSEDRPPLPPFTLDSAIQKVRAAEDACDAHGLMRRRFASINDLPIGESDRLFKWDRRGPRPLDYPSLSDLGL